jgi:hypothetical protein
LSPCDVGDRRCPRVPVAAQTQRGSRPRRLPPCERQSGCSEDLANLGKRLLTCAVGCPLLAAVVRDLPAVRGPSAAQPRGSSLGRGRLRRSGPRDQGPDWPAGHGKGRSVRVATVAGSADIWVARAESCRGFEGMSVPMAADPDSRRPELFTRAEQLRAQSQALREQVAEVADAVAEVEQDVARVHEASLSRVGHWLSRPGSMPTGPGSSRRESVPRRSAYAGLRRAEDRWPGEANWASDVKTRQLVTAG